MDNMYTDGTYLQNNKDWHLNESGWKIGKVLNTIRKNKLSVSTVCDVGCGYGWILKGLNENLKDPTIQYTGYDISPIAIQGSKQCASSNIVFHNKDILCEDVTFDFIMALDVVEHIEDYYGFLRTLRNKGRYKLFHIPLALSVQSIVRSKPLLDDRASVGHIHCFTREWAFAALEFTGYKILDWEYIGKRVEVLNTDWKAKIAEVPRKILFSINKDIAVRLLGGYSVSILAE